MARFQEITFFGRGLSYHVPSRSGVLYVVGFTPPGFKQARDRVSVIQRQGKVVEEGDRLSPSGLPALTIWHERRDKRIARVQRPGACAQKLSTTTAINAFSTTGQPFVEPDGSTFAALQLVGGNDIVRSTYADEGATAHEIDEISAASGLWRSSAVVYLGGKYSGAATSMSSFRYTRRAPIIAPPSVGHCH